MTKVATKPRFAHDCTECKFIGHESGHDHYMCGCYGDCVLIARYGNNPEDNVSMPDHAVRAAFGQSDVGKDWILFDTFYLMMKSLR